MTTTNVSAAIVQVAVEDGIFFGLSDSYVSAAIVQVAVEDGTFFGLSDSYVSAVIVYVATAGTAPDAPSGLTATTVGSSQINCAWTDNSSNEDNFELDYDTSAAFDSPATTVEPAADAVSYSVTSLDGSTLYYFRIRAVNAFGNSAYTASASDTTLVTGSPIAPSDLAAAAVSSSQINLTWTDNS